MRTSHQRTAFRLFKILVSLVFFVAGTHSVMAACPSEILAIPGFAQNALGECILTDKVVKVDKTLTLSSNTTLNCQDHILAPKTKQVRGTDVTDRSKPEVAIFLDGAQNVVIKNCRIFGFDFGIFAINSKRSPGSTTPPIRILNNRVIEARFVDISLMSVDDAEIKGNHLIVRRKGGRGLYVGRNSDRNRIRGNLITVILPTESTAPETTQTVRVPGLIDGPGAGGVLVDPGTNPLVSEGSAVLITQTEGAEPILLNAIIEGKLHQLVFDNPTEPADFSENNIVDGNTIRIGGGIVVDGVVRVVDGVVLAVPERTLVSNNQVTGAKNSIRVGIQTGSKRFPGRCHVLDPVPSPHPRFCYVDADCDISPLTPQPPPLGACDKPAPLTKSILWLSPDTTIQDNMILGPFDAGIGTLGQDTTITGNTIVGPLRSVPVFPLIGPPVGGIVLVGKFGLGDTTIVTRNTVRDVAIALALGHQVTVGSQTQPEASATEFKAHISLNDFIGYSTAVLLVKGNTPPILYKLFSELSDNSKGNYWGLVCPTCFELSKVKNSDGSTYSPPPAIQDSFCFRVRVAKASPQPTPCP